MAGVFLHSGEFFLSTLDLDLRRRLAGGVWDPDETDSGITLVQEFAYLPETLPFRLGHLPEGRTPHPHARHHRSQVEYNGPMGHGWELSLNARLAPLGVDVLFYDGTGRVETFLEPASTGFTSPRGL